MLTNAESMVPAQARAAAARVAVIGAGMAGLMAARHLAALGYGVRVFEKSRAPGGRVATRHADALHFDHGAQYFTHRDPRLAEHMSAWKRAGVIAPWTAHMVSVRGTDVTPVSDGTLRWVAVPGMRALGTHLASPLDVRYATTVQALVRDGAGWHVRLDASATDGPFDAVLVTTPAPQAQVLLAEHAPEFLTDVAAARLQPCVALMLELAVRPPVSWDAAFVNEHAVLSWVARNASKPGRSTHECWVAHASAEWSDARLGQEPASLVPLLVEAVADVLRAPITVRHAVAHRWRYAIPVGGSALAHGEARFDAALGLGVAGDWCVGGRVEGALTSGLALAERVSAAWRDAPA